MIERLLKIFREKEQLGTISGFSYRLHIDSILLGLILSVSVISFFVLYSASNQSTDVITKQAVRLAIALGALFVMAQITTRILRIWTPILYLIGLGMLVAVIFVGDVGKGAQRWLDLGFMRFQPSELMKLAVPMMCAWYLHFRPLPPKPLAVIVTLLIVAIPSALIFKQPDLGTALIYFLVHRHARVSKTACTNFSES